MNPTQKDSRVMKGFFTEKEAVPFSNHLCNFLPKGIALRWFWMAFQALEKSGLTYYETEYEETQIRRRLHLVGLIFYEYCYILRLYDLPYFTPWNEEFIIEIFRDHAIHGENELEKIHRAIEDYFDPIEELSNELWWMSQEAKHNCLVPTFKRNSISGYDLELKMKAEDWLLEGFGDISDFECMQSFCQDTVLEDL